MSKSFGLVIDDGSSDNTKNNEKRVEVLQAADVLAPVINVTFHDTDGTGAADINASIEFDSVRSRSGKKTKDESTTSMNVNNLSLSGKFCPSVLSNIVLPNPLFGLGNGTEGVGAAGLAAYNPSVGDVISLSDLSDMAALDNRVVSDTKTNPESVDSVDSTNVGGDGDGDANMESSESAEPTNQSSAAQRELQSMVELVDGRRVVWTGKFLSAEATVLYRYLLYRLGLLDTAPVLLGSESEPVSVSASKPVPVETVVGVVESNNSAPVDVEAGVATDTKSTEATEAMEVVKIAPEVSVGVSTVPTDSSTTDTTIDATATVTAPAAMVDVPTVVTPLADTESATDESTPVASVIAKPTKKAASVSVSSASYPGGVTSLLSRLNATQIVSEINKLHQLSHQNVYFLEKTVESADTPVPATSSSTSSQDDMEVAMEVEQSESQSQSPPVMYTTVLRDVNGVFLPHISQVMKMTQGYATKDTIPISNTTIIHYHAEGDESEVETVGLSVKRPFCDAKRYNDIFKNIVVGALKIRPKLAK